MVDAAVTPAKYSRMDTRFTRLTCTILHSSVFRFSSTSSNYKVRLNQCQPHRMLVSIACNTLQDR